MLRVVNEIFGDTMPFLTSLSNSLCNYDGSQKQNRVTGISTMKDSIENYNIHSPSVYYQGHYSPLFGTICGLQQLSLHATEVMYLRCVLRDAVSAACRLSILGPIEGKLYIGSYCYVLQVICTL